MQNAIDAEDELRERAKTATLSPDRLKQLLQLTGVDEDTAETVRARLEFNQRSSKKWPK